MPIPLTVLPIDGGHGPVEFGDIGGGTRVERVLHDGLLGARRAAEGGLQGGVGPQQAVDLHQPVRPGEERDERIVEFVGRRIADGFLRDLDALTNRAEQVQFAELHAQDGEAGVARTAASRGNCRGGQIGHGGHPPLVAMQGTRGMGDRQRAVKSARRRPACSYFGRNLGF